MANKRDFNFSGAPEVRAALAQVKEHLRNRVMRRAISKCLTPLVRLTKQNLTPRRRTGLLKKSIIKKVKTYPSGVTIGMVGAATDVLEVIGGKRVRPMKYSHLVEYGTQPHMQPRRGKKGGVKHPGSKAYPALNPAWAAIKDQAVDVIANAIRASLETKTLTGDSDNAG